MLFGDLMNGVPPHKAMASNKEGIVSGGFHNDKKHMKCVKRKVDNANLELREGIKLHGIMNMEFFHC